MIRQRKNPSTTMHNRGNKAAHKVNEKSSEKTNLKTWKYVILMIEFKIAALEKTERLKL